MNDNFLMKRDDKTIINQRAMSEQVIEAILNGEVDPLVIDVHLRAVENVIALIRKNAQVQVKTVSERQKYPEKYINILGAEVSIASRKTYDFTYCKDPVWNGLQKEKETVAEKIKKRQGLLKGIEESIEFLDPSTGELVEVTTPDFKEKTFLKIEFKKGG